MSGKPQEEMPEQGERRLIAMITDVLLSVGATWPVVMQELLRMSREPNPPFLSVPSQKTIERIFLDEMGYENMTDFRAKRDETIKVRLKYKALMMAMSGNVPMLIFSLKNVCGWSDNIKLIDPNENDPNKKGITVAYSKGSIKRKAK